MDSASLEFVGFGLLASLVSNFSKRPSWRSSVLLLTSLLFIWLIQRTNPWQTLLPFAGFLVTGFCAVKFVERGGHHGLLIGVLAVVFSYLWLKKYTFFPPQSLLPGWYFTLGLSYIFFRVLSLLVANADPESRVTLGLMQYLTYLLNFTTFVSGPIQSYEKFAEDQYAAVPATLNARIVGVQLERIVRGFFKVNVLSMLLLSVQQDELRALAAASSTADQSLRIFVLVVAYPFFLYCNFSGYIDIVIALARLMRLRLPENFDRPFSAASFIEFWSRWHITLSNWLKARVYNPLLMMLMRKVPAPGAAPMLGVMCFFVTFFLVGIWHGRTSEFVVFGLLQGGGVAVNKMGQIGLAKALGRKTYRHLASSGLYVAAARGLTFSYFAFTLFWFWASWQQVEMLERAISVRQWLGVWTCVWAAATVVLAAWEWLRATLLSLTSHGRTLFSGRYALVVCATVLGFIAVLVTAVLNQPAPDVVYKAF